MIKTYRANTNISINVVLPSKKNLHVTFNALSNGSSVYTTDNEEIQNAIERHYKFGTLFKLTDSTPNPAKAKAKSKIVPPNTETTGNSEGEGEEKKGVVVDTPPADEGGEGEETTIGKGEEEEEEGDEDEDTSSEESSLRQVQVSDIATAKDYLAEKFGISRTSMRSTKSIMEHAKAQGIEFVGL